ncbi:MAG: ABC transporter permease [Archangium sp.]|nr:ABC transporter permease [Archangium sp.]
MLLSTFLMALREVRRNTMRSLLTMLGVVIGVAAVIALMTIGEGATAKVRQNIGALGNNLLMISPGADRRVVNTGQSGKPFDESDVQAITRELAGIEHVAPTQSRPLQVIAGSRNWRTTVTGTTADYLVARSFKVARGSGVEQALSTPRAVCVLGATPARELFGTQNPLGQSVRVGRLSCEVIAVLESKGAGGMGGDNDDLVLMPLRTFQQRIAGNRDVTMIYATAREGRSTAGLKRQVEELFRERRRVRPGEQNDFSVRDMQEIIDTVSSTVGMLTALLGAVAAVSLLVGGIGIMNIMLVSVTERTREIGTRLAIGALGSDVLLQFLIEAVTLSSLGGVIGMVVGLLGAAGICAALGFPFLVSGQMVLLAFAFSAGVGVLFGYLPARKAAHFNPIEALRHE